MCVCLCVLMWPLQRDFLGDYECNKYQTLHDACTYWALPVHATFNVLCTSCFRSQQASNRSTESGTFRWVPPKGDRGISDSLPPVWNLRAVSLIPLFYISSLVLLPSPVALTLTLFCFCPILLTTFSLNLIFPKGRLFCVALVFLFVWAFTRWVLLLVVCAAYTAIWHWDAFI